MKQFFLYNPLAGNGMAKEAAEKLAATSPAEAIFSSVTEITDYAAFLAQITPEDTLTVCGGDGTLNHFVNDTADLEIPCEVYYLAVGSGNDFLRDIGKSPDGNPVSITKYIQNLPVTEVKGKTYRFLNGIGFGIDGDCCVVAEKMKAEGKK